MSVFRVVAVQEGRTEVYQAPWIRIDRAARLVLIYSSRHSVEPLARVPSARAAIEWRHDPPATR